LHTLRGVRQGLEHLQPLREVANCLEMRRALDSTLARSLPIGDGLRHKAGLRIVLCQHFGLGLYRLGKLLLQHLRNALMVLLPRAAQE
jgi:hypothetical protein